VVDDWPTGKRGAVTTDAEHGTKAAVR